MMRTGAAARTGAPMQELYAIFADDRQMEVRVESGMLEGRSPDQAFDRAAKVGALFGRKLKGMWIIDPLTERPALTKVYGSGPMNIHHRITSRTRVYKHKDGD